MKKALILFLAFALVGAVAFAEGTDPVAFSVSGSATIQWGIDLDDMYTGFSASSDGPKIKALLAGPSQKKDGEVPFGEISIGGVKIEADGAGAFTLKYDSASAKLDFGDLEIGFWGNIDNVTSGYQGIGNLFSYSIYDGKYGADNLASQSGDDKDQFVSPGSGKNEIKGKSGVNVSFTLPDVVKLGMKLISQKDWTEGHSVTEYQDAPLTNPESGGYAINPYVELKAVAGLTLNAGMNMSFGYDDKATPTVNEEMPMGFGVKAAYDIALGEGMKITPAVAFDYMGDVKVNDTDVTDSSAMGITAGVKAELDKLLNLTVNFGYLPNPGAANTGDVDDSKMALTAALDVKAVEGLTLKAAFELLDATNLTYSAVTTTTTPGTPYVGIVAGAPAVITPAATTSTSKVNEGMGIFFQLGYDVKADALTITPWLKGSYDTYDKTAAALAGEDSLFLKAGIDVKGAIANTTLSLAWDSSDLIMADATAPVKNNTMGKLVIGAKVSF